jgi:hypothetical protein
MRALLLLCLTIPSGVLAQSQRPILKAISGTNERAPVDTELSERFGVRLTNSNGTPLVGATVIFQNNYCVEFSEPPLGSDADQCPTEFGEFLGDVRVPTDAGGYAFAPPYRTGSVSGAYSVIAGAFPAKGFSNIVRFEVSQFDTFEAAEGSWEIVGERTQGLTINDAGEGRTVAAWYVITDAGEHRWYLLDSCERPDNSELTSKWSAPCTRTSAVQSFAISRVDVSASGRHFTTVGTARISFQSCTEGTAVFEMDDEGFQVDDTFVLRKVAGTKCSIEADRL